MRQILFRGKRQDRLSTDWVFGSLINEPDGSYWIDYYPEGNRHTCQVDPETVGQYTCIDDENGKMIFEADIIECHLFVQELGYNLGVVEGERSYKGSVGIDEWGTFIKTSKSDEGFYLVNPPGNLQESPFNVIGNIHDKP